MYIREYNHQSTTKPRTPPASRVALANADEWTGQGGVGEIADRILKLKEFEGK